MTDKQVVTEKVDIRAEASSSDLEVYSDGSLESLDILEKRRRIDAKWLKDRALVWMSIAVIITILVVAVALVFFDNATPAKDWAFQALSTLLGFAAGAIFQSKSAS